MGMVTLNHDMDNKTDCGGGGELVRLDRDIRLLMVSAVWKR